MRRGPWPAWILAAATAAMVVIGGVFAIANRDVPQGAVSSPPWVGFVLMVTSVPGSAIGFVLATRRPRNPIGWILGVGGLFPALDFASYGYAVHGILVAPGSLPAASWAAWFGNWFSPEPSWLLLLAFFLFPTGALPSPRWRLALLLPVLVALGFAAPALVPGPLVPGPLASLGVENPAGIAWFPTGLGDGAVGGRPLIVGATLAFWSLGVRYRRAGSVERQQIKWLLLPAGLFVATVTSIALANTTGHSGDPNFQVVALGPSLTVTALAASMGVAILRYRLYDIDLLINRTIVYGVTSAAIAATFFAGIIALQAVLKPLTSSSELAVAASTLVSFALFQPIRRRLQDAVDRRFDRSRHDAARMLDTFADELRDEVDLDDLRADLIAAVDATMAPAAISLWLRERPG